MARYHSHPGNACCGRPPVTGPEPGAAAAALQLAADPRIRSATAEGMVVSVVPTAEWLAAERAGAHAAISSRMLAQWQMVYDRTYRWNEAVRPPNFDAWISSFTGAPMAQASMQSWLDATVHQLRQVPHGRVLDLGCGVGLVLAALAPHCTAYHGIDFSEEAIAALGAWAASRENLRHVTLAARAAHELDDLPQGGYDVIVLNSVVQYFPDALYLMRVLRAASARLAPGGAIYLGDLRALALLPVQAAAVAVARAPAGMDAGELRGRMLAAQSLNRELALDPGFFDRLMAEFPGISEVRFHLKPADADPELAAYRYDVTLIFGGAAAGAAPETAWSRAAFLQLARERPEQMVFQGIPNARVAHHVALARRLEAVPPGPDEEAISPDVLSEEIRKLGYQTELRLTPGAADGRFDLLAWRGARPAWPCAGGDGPLASDPLLSELAARLAKSLQRSLGNQAVRIVIEIQ